MICAACAWILPILLKGMLPWNLESIQDYGVCVDLAFGCSFTCYVGSRLILNGVALVSYCHVIT
jgi:hypothetical protein